MCVCVVRACVRARACMRVRVCVCYFSKSIIAKECRYHGDCVCEVNIWSPGFGCAECGTNQRLLQLCFSFSSFH